MLISLEVYISLPQYAYFIHVVSALPIKVGFKRENEERSWFMKAFLGRAA